MTLMHMLLLIYLIPNSGYLSKGAYSRCKGVGMCVNQQSLWPPERTLLFKKLKGKIIMCAIQHDDVLHSYTYFSDR